MKVAFVAAHHGFSLDQVPLGGGGTVAAWLAGEWRRTRPFDLDILDPSLLGERAPRQRDLVDWSEWRYARFCRDFEAAASAAVLHLDPRDTVVLANDISEGPALPRLAAAGFPIFTIFHVDVLDYFCRLYLRGLIRPERAARLYAAWSGGPFERFTPSLLRLVFQKQQDVVRFSRGLIVMTSAMREVLHRCYPELPKDHVHVMPWGLPERAVSNHAEAASALAARHPALPGSPVILSLSRVTPEKGQDRVLEALRLWENSSGYPASGVTYRIAGDAAYMQGKRFLRRLKRMAARLKRTRVQWLGYVAGDNKEAAFAASDLYVFPSRHDSYGLTLLEAMRSGLPVLAADSYGARDLVNPSVGWLLPPMPESRVPEALKEQLAIALSSRAERQAKGEAARAFAGTQRFEATAARLASLLQSARASL